MQSLYFGQLRYWLYSLYMPTEIITQVQNDANELMWKKDPIIGGEKRRIRRFVAEHTALGPREKGGLNVMPWREHVKAVQASWMIRYLHPAESDWKHVLDTMMLQDERPPPSSLP